MLTAEILLAVLQHVDVPTLVRCSRVSRSFYALANDPLLYGARLHAFANKPAV